MSNQYKTKRSDTKTAEITISEDTKVRLADGGSNVLGAGTYVVEMPADYDPALVTAEDIIMDESLRIVREVSQ